MDVQPETLAAWGSIVATGLGAIWAVRSACNKALRRVGRVEKRVSTLWRFHMARGYVEAVTTGQATQAATRSLELTPTVRARFNPIAAELRLLHMKHKTLDRDELMEVIEDEYSEWLVDNVCLPLGIFHGACLQLAFEVSAETVRD